MNTQTVEDYDFYMDFVNLLIQNHNIEDSLLDDKRIRNIIIENSEDEKKEIKITSKLGEYVLSLPKRISSISFYKTNKKSPSYRRARQRKKYGERQPVIDNQEKIQHDIDNQEEIQHDIDNLEERIRKISLHTKHKRDDIIRHRRFSNKPKNAFSSKKRNKKHN